MHSTFTILSEPRGREYRKLIEFAAARSTMFGLVDRDGHKRSSGHVFGTLEQDLVSQSRVDEWPGTKLLNEEVVRLLFRVSDASVCFLKAMDGLYSWLTPFPEDLHFLRQDGTVLLASIAHEQDSFVSLDPLELSDFRRLLPGIEISADE